jgi:hypothetical protein
VNVSELQTEVTRA